jgi:hypothetical protein
MTDFKKDIRQRRTTDDQSPIPAAPFSIAQIFQDIHRGSVRGRQETDREAAPYWSAAWETVQEKFEAVLETYGQTSNAMQYKDLPADEFKIKMLTEAAIRTEITKIMEDVQRAVESVESRPKPAKQSNAGQ